MRTLARLTLLVASGCGARSALVDPDAPARDADASASDAPRPPRVADCERLAAAEPLAVIRDPTEGLALDGRYVYFVDGGRLRRVDREAGGEGEALGPDFGAPFQWSSIVVSGEGAFFDTSSGVVRLAPDGRLTRLVTEPTVHYTRHLAVFGSTLYAGVQRGPSAQVVRVGSDATGLETLHVGPSSIWDIAADRATLYVADSARLVAVDLATRAARTLADAVPRRMALEPDGLFAIGDVDARTVVFRVEPGSGAVRVLAPMVGVALAASGPDLFVLGVTPASAPYGVVARVPKAGGAVTAMARASLGASSGNVSYFNGSLAVDEGHVYFVDPCIHRAPPFTSESRLVRLRRDATLR